MPRITIAQRVVLLVAGWLLLFFAIGESIEGEAWMPFAASIGAIICFVIAVGPGRKNDAL